MQKKPLIERIYKLVILAPGRKADEYLVAEQASIRSGGVLTHLGDAGFLRWEKSAGEAEKRWYPVLVNGQPQPFDPNHPYFTSLREKTKLQNSDEQKYHRYLGEVMDKLACCTLDYDTKNYLYQELVIRGYGQMAMFRELGLTKPVAAKNMMEVIEKVDQEINKLTAKQMAQKEQN